MRVRTSSITILLASLVAASGCSKKETPVLPTAHATTEAAKPTAAPAGETKPVEAADAGTQAAADTSPPAKVALEPVKLGEPIVPPTQAPMELTTIATYPEGIVAVSGIQSIDALVAGAGLKDTLKAKMIKGAIAQRLGVPNVDWVADDKPIRLAVPDPKAYPDGFVIVVPLVPDAKLDLPTTANEGHLAKLAVGTRTVFFDKFGDALVATSHPDLFKKFQPFIKDTLTIWNPGDTIVLEANVEALMKTYADELKQAETMLPMAVAALKQKGITLPQGGQMLAMVQKLLAFSRDLERATFAVDLRGSFPRIGFALLAKDGSALAKDLEPLETSKISMASEIAADAWFALAMDITVDLGANPSSIIGAIQEALERQGMGFTPDELQKLTAVTSQIKELSKGPSAFWLSADGEQPVSFQSVSQSLDATALRNAEVDFFGLLAGKVWGAARGKMLELGLPAERIPPASDVPGAIELVNKLAGGKGIHIGLDNGEVAKGVSVSVAWAGMPLRGMLGELLPILIGPKFEFGIAGAEKRFAVAFGPSGVARAAAIAKATTPSGPPAWLGDAAQSGFALAVFRPAQVAVLLAQTPLLAAQRDLIAKLPDAPFVLKASSVGRKLRFELAIPRDLMTALSTLF